MEYLAGPYSHSEEAIRKLRYECHRQCCAGLLLRGRIIFSPIVHGHNLLPELAGWGHDEWLKYDFRVLARCMSLIILTIPGWDESRGVKAELDFARERKIPVMYLAEGEFPN